jgi:putative flippase GtrA
MLRFLRQASAYISVAGASAASDWLVFTAFSWLMPDRDVVYAQALARLTGGLVAFSLHRSWSFRDQEGLGLTTEAGRFLALYVFSFCLSLGIVYALVDFAGVNRFAGKAVADTLCFVVNFFVMKLWVFSAATAPHSKQGGTN